MLNKNKIIALACATALIWANITFAKESSSAWMPWMDLFKKTMQNTSEVMKTSEDMYKKSINTASGMQMPNQKIEWKAPIVSQFFKKDMSQEEKDALKLIIDSYIISLKEIWPKSSSWTSNPTNEEVTAMKEKIATFNKDFVEKITPYIDSIKLEEFKKFAEINWDRPFIINPEDKKPEPRGQEKPKEMIKKSLLSQKTRDLINKKIDSISSDKKETYLNKLISKIDTLVEKTKNDKIKGMLLELKMLLKTKLENLSQDQEEDDSIDNLLDDSDDTTSTWTIN